ncbi:MAG: NAD(P)(+) transhydrogenase (Re/Si-specific) subunit beta [Oscillospiraceae bacterium]|nr:NAD(P)(+) transhydrogenase (Re/Si-specific) subunit beta [Oscillospiraceae bacterium]
MNETSIIFYIISGLVIFGTLVGIAMMSKVKTAVMGNKIGAISILAAILLTLWYNNILTVIPLMVVMVASLIFSVWWSSRVKMIAMPQMVALLNGIGGVASAIVGAVFLVGIGEEPTVFTDITSGLAITIGMITFFGSMIAVGKLSGKLGQKPVILPLHQFLTTALLVLSFIMVGIIAWGGLELWIALLLISALSAAFGIVFSIRIGGADMPITISLLNSMTGVALSAAGMSVGDPMLIAVGGIVGAAGLILTQIMCKGMNRSLLEIIMGKTTVAGTTTEVAASSASNVDEVGLASCVSQLKDAKRVLIVPGYGVALSGAQNALKSLSDALEENGAKVDFTIHPVAGRTAGHMNVLLADADIPYEKLRETRSLDSEINQYDVVVAVGANDIINPAAITAKDTAIYGLPILNIENVKQVILCNLDTKPGRAGVSSPLYTKDNVTLLLGDASETVGKLADKLSARLKTNDISVEVEKASKLLTEAKKVIIIPGYGMALANAQGLVRELSDKLEKKGTSVDFAIHPVAGRMPGHMNVLLAEVDISYDKLREMNDINPEFANCDVCVVVGANDVINPAARDAVGTPIYGMPILSADEAKHVIICNYDTKPGYAGVDNPLYTSDAVTLLLGDAAKTLKDLIGRL